MTLAVTKSCDQALLISLETYLVNGKGTKMTTIRFVVLEYQILRVSFVNIL